MRNDRGRRRTARAAPFRRRACALRQATFRASLRKPAGRRQAQTAPLIGWSFPAIQADPVWLRANLLPAKAGQCRTRAQWHATRARERRFPSDAPCPGIDGQAPIRDRIVSASMMGGETFNRLKAGLLGAKNAKQAEPLAVVLRLILSMGRPLAAENCREGVSKCVSGLYWHRFPPGMANSTKPSILSSGSPF